MFRTCVSVKSCASKDEQRNILSSQNALSAVLQNICKNYWVDEYALGGQLPRLREQKEKRENKCE